MANLPRQPMVVARLYAPLVVLSLAVLSLSPASWGDERVFYAEDIKAAMAEHIESRIDEAGRFFLVDDETGERLTLRFVKIHDPVREFEDRRYFACTDFAVDGAPEQLYDLDFWRARWGSA